MVTGHTGFKGSWLAIWLRLLGAEVIGYSLEPVAERCMFNLCDMRGKVIHIAGDIRDEEKLRGTIAKYRPEIVFHLAAQPLVRTSYSEPYYTFDTNIMGTVSLCEAIRKTEGVSTVVAVTSDKCYKNRESFYGYRETDPMGGDDPYSASKGCAELVSASYRKSFFRDRNINISTARAGNVIGGGDWAEDRLIPDCVRAVTRNKEIVVRNPQSVRPWQYVLEPLSGYLWLGALMHENRNEYGDSWNFGPEGNDALTVGGIVKLFMRHWGSGSCRADSHEQPCEASLLSLDIAKAKFLLGWKPVLDVSEAVEKTVRWYKEYYERGNKALCDYSENQIGEYCEKAYLQKIGWSMPECSGENNRRSPLTINCS